MWEKTKKLDSKEVFSLRTVSNKKYGPIKVEVEYKPSNNKNNNLFKFNKGRIFLLHDHKVGYRLSNLLIRQIEQKISTLEIDRKTFYRFWDVDSMKDKWIVIIRHPYEIITSGYNYHKICRENWAIKKGGNYYQGWINKKELFPEGEFSAEEAYQHKLNNMSVEDGIEFEMRNVGYLTVDSMYHWKHYDLPNVLTVKFEDLTTNFLDTVKKILNFIDVKESDFEEVLESVKHLDFKNLTKEEIMSDDHITNKEKVDFVYKKLWKPRHYQLARELFEQDLLSKFGYEK